MPSFDHISLSSNFLIFNALCKLMCFVWGKLIGAFNAFLLVEVDLFNKLYRSDDDDAFLFLVR